MIVLIIDFIVYKRVFYYLIGMNVNFLGFKKGDGKLVRDICLRDVFYNYVK